MTYSDMLVSAFVLAGVFILMVWVLVSLTKRLREERAAQAPQDRSPLSLLIAAGIGAYLFAYFAFGGHLEAPKLLALAVLAAASFSAVRRFLP